MIRTVPITLLLLGSLLAPLVSAAPPKGPVSVLIVECPGQPTPAERLKGFGFDVQLVSWKTFEPNHIMGVDVIVLPTQWADDPERLRTLESRKDQFHWFVKRGGGLLLCQPNTRCQPKLLPYPITFQRGYDDEDKDRVNLGGEHFITKDLRADQMPFPFDTLSNIDPHYKVLAMQKATKIPSLAVCSFGDGRVVVLAANENRGKSEPRVPLEDEPLKRMVVWAAMRDTPMPAKE